jgi:hypothetical protein
MATPPGALNDLEVNKFLEIAGKLGIRVFLFDASGDQVTPASDAKLDDILTELQQKTEPADTQTVVLPAASTALSWSATLNTGGVQIVAANANRKVIVIVNNSNQDVFLRYGTGTPLVNNGIRLNANGGALVEDRWTGIISGVCASGSATVTVNETS